MTYSLKLELYCSVGGAFSKIKSLENTLDIFVFYGTLILFITDSPGGKLNNVLVLKGEVTQDCVIRLVVPFYVEIELPASFLTNLRVRAQNATRNFDPFLRYFESEWRNCLVSLSRGREVSEASE